MKLNSPFNPRSYCYTQNEMTEGGEGFTTGNSDGYGSSNGVGKTDYNIWEEERPEKVCGGGSGTSDGACCALAPDKYGGLGRGSGGGKGTFEGRGDSPRCEPF